MPKNNPEAYKYHSKKSNGNPKKTDEEINKLFRGPRPKFSNTKIKTPQSVTDKRRKGYNKAIQNMARMGFVIKNEKLTDVRNNPKNKDY